MNSQAKSLNETIQNENKAVYEMLSDLGKEIYFPKQGIISQSNEAKQQAHQFNATIGTAIEHGKPMYLDVFHEKLSPFEPKDLYPYAPPAGKAELRDVWKAKMLAENPDLKNKNLSQPIVTNALTHGISMVADLFADKDDTVILPDKNWENYGLSFDVRRGTNTITYPLYNDKNQFNSEGLREAIVSQKSKGKAIVVLNFPNNPTGYTPSEKESDDIAAVLKQCADDGMNLVVAIDDAYYGLFFEDSMKHSIFGKIASIHPRILAIRVDGATKEEYVWGFRVGFITFAAESTSLLQALEQKATGLIRATISSVAHPSQTFILDGLQNPDFKKQQKEKYNVMNARALKTKSLLDSGKYDDAWSYYPFNSGYFMCLKLKHVEAETLRMYLLEKHGIGTIALGEKDLRIAFSCIDEENLTALYDTVYTAAKQLEQG
ncbi:aminotransferase class I/II-fold pyridoxal phosphate-dependent enzyme [Longirhabdus pacifica]|uniref:aminotransferase class I/II-fold pyridoxal phosphate-dependent enzyme n=1 Tax=Longirhabdus pacifica TaxID=2305227 RepID=UPI0010089FB9|nr:aminotransferase class I/II-fold pyridoxal phosphate-dependent enzyme [Longirhabdus pacifica]